MTRLAAVARLIASADVLMTSSAGRLFDAVASLVGLGDIVSYEGQAAMQLEAIAEDGEPYAFPLVETDGGDDRPRFELDACSLIRGVVSDLESGVAASRIGGRFHAGLAAGIVGACAAIRRVTGLSTVALSGGCFQNRRLLRLATAQLQAADFEVLTNSRVPCGDGGIALGQAAVAAWRLAHVSGDSR